MGVGQNPSRLIVLLGLILFINLSSVNCFLDDPLFSQPEHYSQLEAQCAKKGVTVDDDLMENVRECMTPISAEIKESGGGKDTSKILPTFCKQLPALKGCYKKVIDLVETCYDDLFANNAIFPLGEIVDNAAKAFCSEEKDDRITEALGSYQAVLATFACGARHYMAIMGDLFSCSSVKLHKQILMDPSVLKDYSPEEICTEMDKLEKCLVSTLDLCDKQEVVVKFIKLVYDIIVGIGFKCPNHQNFE